MPKSVSSRQIISGQICYIPIALIWPLISVVLQSHKFTITVQ